MYKKLDDAALNTILETGVAAFAQCGLDGANINTIAKQAGVSVGVVYKYFGDKDGLFLACVRYSLSLLDSVLREAVSYETEVMKGIESILAALIKHAREHPSHNALYNELGSGGCRQYAALLAREIEGVTAGVYSTLLENAQAAGRVDPGLDAPLFAFFFDNLLMMLQFSYSCEYYTERMKIFCGEDILDNPERMTGEFIRFMRSALKAQ